MLDFITSFFNSRNFIPHGHCYLWNPGLVWLHILSDSLTSVAYYSISVTLFYLVRKREDLPFNWIFLLFAIFINACGTTHLLEVWTLWHPVYWFSGTVKGVTALASQGTAMVLISLIPKALSLPSRSELEAVNQQLRREISERKQAEIALQKSEILYRAIVEDQTEFIARYLPDGTLSFINRAFALYFGQSPEELIGSRYQPVVFEADREQVAQLIASMNANNPTVIIENRVVVGNQVRWTQWHNRMVFDNQGNFIEYQSVGRDITTLKQTQETLFQEKELAQVTLKSIGDAVITTDAAGRIRSINPVAESLTGWSEGAAKGLLSAEVFKIVDEATKEPIQNPIEQALQENRIVGLPGCATLIHRNGHEVAIEDSVAPICNPEGQIIGTVMVFHDVTQTRAFSRQLSWQATHDVLTGLINRWEFERQIEQALIFARSKSQTHALCYLDLDRFKIVNDACGHAGGDELLRQVAVLLQEKIRHTDILTRLGGDEFGILLHQCTLEQALRIATELCEYVQAVRFVWQEQTFTIGVSIGLVQIDANSENPVDLISAADAACYKAKNQGRNQVYVAQMNDQVLEV